MKWHWTPSGWVRAVVFVGLMIGGAFLRETASTASTMMLIAGCVLLAYSWIATAINIKKRNKERGPNDAKA